MSEIVIETINRFSPNLHRCPYKAKENLRLENFLVSEDLLPISLPFGQYRFDLEFFPDNKASKRYLLVQVYVTAKKS